MATEKKNIVEKNRKRAEKLIRLYIDELSSPEKLSNAPINQIASALCTLIDKFGAPKAQNEEGGNIYITHNVPRASESEKE